MIDSTDSSAQVRALTPREIYLCKRFSMDQSVIAKIDPASRYKASEIAIILDVSYHSVRRRIRDGLIHSTQTFNPSVTGESLLDFIWTNLRSGRNF